VVRDLRECEPHRDSIAQRILNREPSTMKTFHCDHCRHLIFFENVQCVKCGHALAYLPDLSVVGSLEPVEGGLWKSPLSGPTSRPPWILQLSPAVVSRWRH
jgi:hypothetical protein